MTNDGLYTYFGSEGDVHVGSLSWDTRKPTLSHNTSDAYPHCSIDADRRKRSEYFGHIGAATKVASFLRDAGLSPEVSRCSHADMLMSQ